MNICSSSAICLHDYLKHNFWIRNRANHQVLLAQPPFLSTTLERKERNTVHEHVRSVVSLSTGEADA